MPLDLKSTINLPKTDFPMKANLPQNEPEILAKWEQTGSTSRFVRLGGRTALRSARWTALRQWADSSWDRAQ